MNDHNGRWKAPPYIWMTIAGWILMLGVNIGSFWNLKSDVSDIKKYITSNVRSRTEGDEIVKRLDAEDLVLLNRMMDIELRVKALEKRQ